jgi:hypothetical protein
VVQHDQDGGDPSERFEFAVQCDFPVERPTVRTPAFSGARTTVNQGNLIIKES